MRARLQRLPQRGSWEVDLVEVPGVEIKGTTLEGIMVVLNRPDGHVRAMAPIELGEDVSDTLVRAALDPHEAHDPSRPRTVHCRKSMAPRIQSVARKMGASLKFAKELPLVSAVADVLISSFAPSQPLVPSEPARWTPWLRELVDLAPWTMLPDAVRFELFRGGRERPDGVGVLVGLLGQQRGINWFHTIEDHERFFELAERGESPIGEASVSCVHLDPIEAIPDSLLEAAQAVGLVHGGLAASFFTVAREGIRPMTPDEEHRCLETVIAMVTAVRQHGTEALLTRATSTSVPSLSGSQVLRCTPPSYQPAERRLINVEHQVFPVVSSGPDGRQPALVVKMAAANARRFARRLEGVDAISIERSSPGRLAVLAWAGDDCLGPLTHVEEQPSTFRSWMAERKGLLLISAGGAKRTGARPADVVAAFDVVLLENDDPTLESFWARATALAEGNTATGDPGTTLLAFAETLGVSSFPVAEARNALEFASLVWTLAVLEDHGGSPHLIREIRERLPTGAGREFVEMLLERKRVAYPGDTRAFVVERVRKRGGRLEVSVHAAPVDQLVTGDLPAWFR